MKYRYLDTEIIVESDRKPDSPLFTGVSDTEPEKKAPVRKEIPVKKDKEVRGKP